MQSSLDELEKALGYSFTTLTLLQRAVTHSSSANEALQPGPMPEARDDNERLEFLGDAILGLLVSEYLFHRFEYFTEGQLSLVKNRVVSASHLLSVANRLELGLYLQLGKGEETAGGRTKQRLLVNAFEAVLAAVYLDGGMEPARDLVVRFAIPPLAELSILAGAGPPQDFRAELERLSREHDLPRPLYSLTGENGPGHARTFIVEVRLGNAWVASGEGPSKKSASHIAARKVCEMLRARRI